VSIAVESERGSGNSRAWSSILSVSGGFHDEPLAAAAQEQVGGVESAAAQYQPEGDGPTLVALADRIADRVAQQLAPAIAELGRARSLARPAGDPVSTERAATPVGTYTSGLWTARRVAAHYGVTRSFVYQHADELGCIRLGGGRCARLRFDPRVVCERWPMVGEPSSAASPRARSAAERSPRRTERNFELLDFDRDP
jgi:hypothetical protein